MKLRTEGIRHWEHIVSEFDVAIFGQKRIAEIDPSVRERNILAGLELCKDVAQANLNRVTSETSLLVANETKGEDTEETVMIAFLDFLKQDIPAKLNDGSSQEASSFVRDTLQILEMLKPEPLDAFHEELQAS